MLALLSCAFCMASCDVHEFPDIPEKRALHLRLNYDTDMTEWKHLYDGENMIEEGLGETYDNRRAYGNIRYVVRAYPLADKQRISQDYTQEFVFTKDIAEGYNHEVTLDLIPGDYNIMVWSDIVQHGGDTYFHDKTNFAEITLQGEHQGNNDYRDAFRGSGNVTLIADIIERVPDTLDIAMQRPLAKYEFITTDLTEFINKEQTRADAKSKAQSTDGEDVTTKVSIEDYKVVFYYVGFMPNAYSLFTDKPVDSATGVLFESTLNSLSETEASVGFDYVFVNGTESAVTVQIGIYDNEGTQLSLTEPIKVPLRRSHHTIMRGMFLISETSGGISINPEFDGDYNLVFP